MAETGYSRRQVILHWAVVACVAVQLIFHEGMSRAWEANLESGIFGFTTPVILHFAFGSLILFLMMWRFMVRSEEGVPGHPTGDADLQARAAHVVHLAFYALLVALPITGGLAWGTRSEALGEVHEITKNIFVALVILHVLAGLYGQFVQKTGVLSRMRLPKA